MNRVAFDGLALKRRPRRRPIGKIALLEIEIQHPAVGRRGGEAIFRLRPACLLRGGCGAAGCRRLVAPPSCGFGWAASHVCLVDILHLVREDERPLLVADDDIVPLVAVDIADDDLRADARVHIDLVRNEIDTLAALARPF